MIGSWKIGAQPRRPILCGGSPRSAEISETVRRVQDAIDLDLLIVGFRETPDLPRVLRFPPVGRIETQLSVQRAFGHRRHGRVRGYLVVNWRGETSRGCGAAGPRGAK